MASVSQGTDRINENVSDGRARSLANLNPWKAGESGNPGGRSPGLARRVKEATNDGQDLVDFLLGVIANPREKTSDQIAAARELLDRGWGRPEQSVELKAESSNTLLRALADLSPEERRALKTKALRELAEMGEEVAERAEPLALPAPASA